MIWYRLVLTKYISLDSDFVSGEWTKGVTGRWHAYGVPTVYLGDTPETVIAECGKYWICDVAERINNSISSIKGRPPSEWQSEFQKIKEFEAYLAEIEVADDILSLDFVNDPPASEYFKKAGFGNLTMLEIRKNAYLALSGKPTMKIGQYFAQLKQPFLKVPSARTNGVCAVLFPGNYDATKVRVIGKKMVRLFALDKSGKRITGLNIVDLNEDTFEFEIDNQVFKITPLKL